MDGRLGTDDVRPKNATSRRRSMQGPEGKYVVGAIGPEASLRSMNSHSIRSIGVGSPHARNNTPGLFSFDVGMDGGTPMGSMGDLQARSMGDYFGGGNGSSSEEVETRKSGRQVPFPLPSGALRRLTEAGEYMPSLDALPTESEPAPNLARARWKRVYNKHRVSQVFANQLIINRGVYGELSAGETALKRGRNSETEDLVIIPSKSFVIHPASTYRRSWDIFQGVLLIYIAVVVPYRICYRSPSYKGWFYFEIFTDLTFLADIVLNFVTGYVKETRFGKGAGVAVRVVEMRMSAIAWHYSTTWLFVDIIAVLPLDILYRARSECLECSFAMTSCDCENENSGTQGVGAPQAVKLFKLLRLARLLKLFRMGRLRRIFERFADRMFHVLPTITIIKLLFTLVYLGHMIGCLYVLCSQEDFRTPHEKDRIENGDLVPWLYLEFGDDDGFRNASHVEKYISVMYWAFTTMTTVGYGDISAVTIAERCAAIVGMIAGGFMFSYIIGVITEVISSMDISSRSQAKKMQCVMQFIRDHKLPSEERLECMRYFRMQRVQAYPDEDLLNEMPYMLRKRIVFHTYRDVINMVPFFTHQREMMIVEVCSRFQCSTYPPNTLVYQQGEAAGGLYVVGDGKVQVLGALDNEDPLMSSTVLAVLTTGSYFGEEVCVGLSARENTIRCRPATTFYQLGPPDVVFLMDLFPSFYQHLVANFGARNKKLQEREEFLRDKMRRAAGLVRSRSLSDGDGRAPRHDALVKILRTALPSQDKASAEHCEAL